MKMLISFVAACALLVCCAPLFGQGTAPGPEHEWLKEQEGEWEFKMVGGGQEMVGSVTYKMGLGGLWLVSDLEVDMGGGFKFVGHGLDTYDPTKKKFVNIWVDSMMAAPIVSEGELSADKKTLTMLGKGPGQDGKTVEYKMVTEYKDKDTHIFKMWSGDLSGDPMMTATYTRKKK